MTCIWGGVRVSGCISVDKEMQGLIGLHARLHDLPGDL